MRRTLGSTAYTSGFEQELERVFKRTWHYVGAEAALRQPNWVTPVEASGVPLIVASDRDSKLHAFYNVCKHRGGPLALKPGRARQLQCLYHGWCYSHGGELTHASQMEELPEAVSLTSAKLATWEGMVFVAAEEPERSIEQNFAGIVDRIKPYDLSKLKFHATLNYDVRCNWKLYVDNYLEGYHVPFVHPGLNSSLSAQSYSTIVMGHQSLQHAPFASNDEMYGYRGHDAFYYFVYPNLMLNILPDRLQINQVIPTAVDRCRVEFHYFYAADLSADSDYIRRDQTFSEEVQQEDIQICEHLQKSMNSGAYTDGVYHPTQEVALIAFHELIRASMSAVQ